MSFLTKFIHVFCLFSCLFSVEYVEMRNIKLKLVSILRCKDFEMTVKDIPLNFTVSARKVSRTKTLITTNFTLGLKAGPLFLSFRGYQLQQNSAKDLVIKVERLPCKSPLTFQLMNVLSVNVNNDCYVLPGTYTKTNINIEDFLWLFEQVIVGAGKYSFDLEFLRNRDVAACITITADIYEVK